MGTFKLLRSLAQAARSQLGGRSGSPLLLSVKRDNFHDLQGRLEDALADVGGPIPCAGLPRFDPHPLQRADQLLLDWLSELRALTADTGVEIEAPTAELLSLLRTVARAAAPHNHGELLRLLGALTGGVFRGPHTFHLDVANACNVNCKYCWFHSPLSKNRKDAADFDAAWRSQMVDWEVFCGLVDDLHALGTREDVLLSGKGEPLLHPRCLDMVEYIKARGMGVTLFSNGLLVREAARQALVEHGADLLYVSLSSASNKVYEAVHPGHDGSELDEVRENVESLTALKQERGSRVPRIMMVDVLCNLNAHEAVDFYQQAIQRDDGREIEEEVLEWTEVYQPFLILGLLFLLASWALPLGRATAALTPASQPALSVSAALLLVKAREGSLRVRVRVNTAAAPIPEIPNVGTNHCVNPSIEHG